MPRLVVAKAAKADSKSKSKPSQGSQDSKDTSRKRKRKDSIEEAGDGTGNVYDSDALDDDEAIEVLKARHRKTRALKKRRAKDDYVLEDGQEVVGAVVQAPKTGLVPSGQISQNTFDFLSKLNDTECNNRTWFKLHEPVYRVAEKEWQAFVEAFTDVLTGVDSQIPYLPPKDVIHRIYRDVRFSNDKTPYKRNLSASFSRSGRKGIFAGYHISIKPGNESLIAAGTWCPGRNELATIRANIQRNPARLRDVISSSEFVRFFGKPSPHPQGDRQNIFGGEDELKTAPKGISKDHRDIDLLKCRSFAVIYRFLDSEVLSANFTERLADVARVLRPLVYCLNDMMTIQDDDDDEDDQTEDD